MYMLKIQMNIIYYCFLIRIILNILIGFILKFQIPKKIIKYIL